MRIYYKEPIVINGGKEIEVLNLEGEELFTIVVDVENLNDLSELISFTQYLSDVKYKNYLLHKGDPCSRNKLLMCIKDWIKEYNPVMYEFLR